MHGTVVTGRNNIFTVETDAGELLCRIKGKTLALEERAYNPLAPGDRVLLASVDPENRSAVIEERLERANEIARFNRKRDALQTLGANVDLVVAVMSLVRPSFRSRFVDRVLVLAAFHGVAALVVATKADLASSADLEPLAPYRAIGVDVEIVSSIDPERLAGVRDRLAGRRSVLVGQSGVGKSTLVNLLIGRAEQVTGGTDRFHRGRHTTSAARLLHGDGFELIDTPGVRELDCRHVPLEELQAYFPEIHAISHACGHADCSHRTEPTCAVRAAAHSGSIGTDRYESFVRLYTELEEIREQV